MRCTGCTLTELLGVAQLQDLKGIPQARVLQSIVDKKNDEQLPDALNSIDNIKYKAVKDVKYVFFDFDCTQDNGVHEQNKCVAHVVCEL